MIILEWLIGALMFALILLIIGGPFYLLAAYSKIMLLFIYGAFMAGMSIFAIIQFSIIFVEFGQLITKRKKK